LDARGAQVRAEVAAQIAIWEAAQLRCANAVRALTGASPLPAHPTAATPLGYGGSALTSPAPDLPLREIFPVDPIPAAGTTGNPPVVLLPGPMINVPAPPAPGIVDGPGSLLPVPGGSLIFDTAPAPGTGPEPLPVPAPPVPF